MAKKKKAPEAEHAANHERWMISYADMLTLLLALFIVMFAISKVDQAKFIQFAQGANQAFGGSGQVILNGYGGGEKGSDGIMDNSRAPASGPQQMDPQKAAQMIADAQARGAAQAAEKQRLEDLKKKLTKELALRGAQDAVNLSIDERGLVVNILTDDVLFASGQAELQPAGAKVIDLIAPSVKTLPNRLVVEGHMDNVPIRTAQFPSNWELSQARAAKVLQRLIADGLDQGRLSLSAYGEQRPIDTNASDAGRRNNRRVALVLLANVPQPLAAPTQIASPAPVEAPSH